MIKNILNKIPRKKGKLVENRDGGSSTVSSNAAATSRSNNATGSRSGNSNVTFNPGLNSTSNSGLNYGNKHFDTKVNGSAGTAPYEALPSFRDVPNAEKRNLFIKKLTMCCVVFDFNDPTRNLKEKDIKRQTLVELVDYVSSANGKFNETVMQEIVRMVSVNLFRTLSAQPRENKVVEGFDLEEEKPLMDPAWPHLQVDGLDLEEEEPLMDPAWPHLQIVYEFLLRCVTSSETDAKLAKRYIDHSFVLRLLDLFDSEDLREREYLKTVLHRIYGKFMVHRPFIRKAINNIFYRFIFETEKHNGIAELLEILGGIINGFTLPLQKEHKLFLVRALIPLHKPKCITMYHQQLSYCITQFGEKDCKLADTVVRGLLKYWPITNSSKEVMFLGELEEVLEATQPPEFQRCMVPLFRQIGRCLSSSHFQVAERALFLWNNDHIENLIKQNRKVILPIIFPALEKNARSHWNQAVQSLTLNVRKIFSDSDPELFEECLLKSQEDEAREEETKMKREATWKRLEEIAASKATSSEAVLVSGRTTTNPRKLGKVVVNGSAGSAPYEALPSFRDVPNAEKQNLLIKKLTMCCVVFDFNDPTRNLKEKDIKWQTLVEIVDYVSSANGKFNETVMQEIVRMVSVNLFRMLSTQYRENKVVEGFDLEEEEPLMDNAWPHLQIVYELLLRFVASPETDSKLAKFYINHSFVLRLLDLFDSEDPREREYLKTVLHRIYKKFMVLRPFIRKEIRNTFYRFNFETEVHNGIADLLEILRSIINGFALPLKEEHKLLLVRDLIPLHKPKCITMYHQQLSYCITQFGEKDCKLADTVIRGLLKYWPITNSLKEVMFLGELEEVLEATQPPEFQRCMVPLFRQIGRCLSSSHFQVAERALFLWNNNHIENLIKQNRKVILPIIFPALEKNARSHWNQAVQSLTLNVRKIFSDSEPELFEECLLKFQEDEAREEETKMKRETTWKRLEEIASSKATSNEAVLVSGTTTTSPPSG